MTLGTTLVLSFEHCIADGLGAVYLIRDLVKALTAAHYSHRLYRQPSRI